MSKTILQPTSKFGFAVVLVALSALFVAALSSGRSALAATGGRSTDDANLCGRWDFQKNNIEPIAANSKGERTAFVIETGAQVHDAPDDRSPVSRTLDFSKSLEVIAQRQKEGWLQVSLVGTNRVPLGWMHVGDLLCGNRPLLDPTTGLERKAVIQVEGQLDLVKPVPAFPSSSGTVCEANHCAELGRYSIQYILAERDGRVLLAANYNTSATDRLTGWVSSDHIFRWNTALGLRPSESMKDAERVCAYASITKTSDVDCRPILGGPGWFQSGTRLPLLEELPDFYKVAVTSTGVDDIQSLDGTRIKIATEAIKRLNRIDVFFVIDGTDSMQGMFDLLQGSRTSSSDHHPGIVGQVITQLKQKAAEGATFRFGFRIYRDGVPPAADRSLGEVFQLSRTNCEGDDSQYTAFQEAFSKVKAEVVPTPPGVLDDYPENMYGGIYQAIDDMAGCPDNQKLMFVIGDAGYDPAKRRQRRDSFPHAGITVLETPDVVKALQGLPKWQQLGIFFIRMPKDPGVTNTDQQRKDYQRAYDMFGAQAAEIINALFASATAAERNDIYSKQFISLATKDPNAPLGPDKLKVISDTVNTVTQPAMLNAIEVDLKGGAALKEIIEKYRKNQDDVPILFWKEIDQRACATLGTQCTARRFEGVGTLYIRKTDNVIIDVRIMSEQLWKWIEMLRGLGKEDLPPGQAGQKFGQALQRSVQIAVDVDPTDTGEPLDEFVQRVGGLPVRARSPLMGYTLDDFLIRNRLPECEVDLLKAWAGKSASILGTAERGTLRPEFKNAPPGQASVTCPQVSSKGKNIPVVPYTITDVPLGPPMPPDKEYSYMHKMDGVFYFWIPMQFMP